MRSHYKNVYEEGTVYHRTDKKIRGKVYLMKNRVKQVKEQLIPGCSDRPVGKKV